MSVVVDIRHSCPARHNGYGDEAKIEYDSNGIDAVLIIKVGETDPVKIPLTICEDHVSKNSGVSDGMVAQLLGHTTWDRVTEIVLQHRPTPPTE
ncbi:MAG: hypothetical protein V1664_03035 [Candidatus Uhrbacteria bacterium]